MNITKNQALLGILAVLVVVLAARWLWPDGAITLDFQNAPVSKVIASIERQGHVSIVTNLPPEATVSIQMTRAQLLDVLETLAVRTGTDLRAVSVGAPNKSQAAGLFAGLQSEKLPDNLEIAWFPSFGMGFGSTVTDPRQLRVQPEASSDGDLKSACQQIAMKSGLMTVLPKDWNPQAKMPTGAASASELTRKVVAVAGGGVKEGFLLFSRGSRDRTADGSPRPDRAGRPPGGGDGGPGRGGGGPGREGMNPEWMAQRAEAAIAQLPKEEQPAAKADFDEMRKFWAEVRALPDDQRREKMQEFFSRPEVQEKMAARMEARDNRRTPAQREQRMKNYVQRKEQMKSAGATP